MNTKIVKMTLEAARVNAGYKQSEAAKNWALHKPHYQVGKRKVPDCRI